MRILNFAGFAAALIMCAALVSCHDRADVKLGGLDDSRTGVITTTGPEVTPTPTPTPAPTPTGECPAGWTLVNGACACSAGFTQIYDKCLNDDSVIEFPDKNLKTKVIAALGITGDAIKFRDLKKLKELDASIYWQDDRARAIKDLTGLEYAIALEKLNLSGNELIEIKQLAPLTALKDLALSNNAITNIGALAALTNLERLEMLGWPRQSIADITPLSGLRSLKELYITNGSYTSASPLLGLTSLLRLEIGYKVTDIQGLKEMRDLKHLEIVGGITDIGVLKNFSKLASLSISSADLKDINAISDLASLRDLSVILNQQHLDIGVLNNPNLSQLAHLDLTRSNPADFSPISSLTNLNTLSLRENGIGDAIPFRGPMSLLTLDLGGNQINNLVGLLHINPWPFSRDCRVDVSGNPLSLDPRNDNIVTMNHGTIKDLKGSGVFITTGYPEYDQQP